MFIRRGFDKSGLSGFFDSFVCRHLILCLFLR